MKALPNRGKRLISHFRLDTQRDPSSSDIDDKDSGDSRNSASSDESSHSSQLEEAAEGGPTAVMKHLDAESELSLGRAAR